MSSASSEDSRPAEFSPGYVRYAVGMLSVVYVFNFADRQILSILMQPIKQEMQLTDTELGLLSGLAFAAFYTVMGLPIARLADKYSRVKILTVCLSLWSLMTVLSGLAANFAQLLAARIGMGVGEAGGGPSSHSLISDYVPVERRATALGIFALGVPVGLLFGYLLGGWLEQLYGWRSAFLALGAPGLLLAVVLRFTMREPPRGHSQGGVKIQAETPPVKAVVLYMWRIPTFWHMALGGSLQAFGTYAIFQWMPSFLVRTHHMQSGEIGSWLALIIGGGGAIGSLAGGYFADRLSRRDMRWQMWLPAICMLLAAPASLGIYLTDSRAIALGFLVLPVTLVNSYLGPTFAITQTLAPLRMRAMASAVLIFALTFIGLGLGPQAVGILSDQLRPAYAEQSLRYAMMVSGLIYIWSAYHFWRAARTLRADLARAAE